MGTLSSLVDLSKSALQANQAALDVTGSNVANQNVVGYTRETLNWSSDVVQIGGASVGVGVSTSSPVSQRDRVLEQRVQQQTQVSSQSTALQSALNQLQGVFGLSATSASGTTTDLSSAIDGLYSSFSSLAASPASSTVRQTVLTAAGTLASAFQSASGQIASVNSGLTQTAISTVSAINGLTATIASLNQQIARVSPDADAGTLEDQRQAAVAQLSQYIGLDQVTTENNGLTLSTSSGAVLVAGAQSFALKGSSVAGKTQITDGVSTVDISGQITGGQLGGILAAQQNEIPSLTSSLDQLAYAIGTSVNTQNAAGLDGNGAAGGALFALNATSSGAASSIAVTTTDPSKIAAAGTGEGSAGNTNANALAALGTASLLGGESASSYLTGVLGTLGSAVAGATTDQTAQQATLAQLTTQRDSLSGVSLDDEAADLTKYQRSYQAASKLFQIVDTIIEAAINLGTETAV
ncbi:flagellar hook-associated protein FlgK [Granulicella sibirica]|uniref:Flagellar hook-associated protein 1 n=1 Tax=Granulicella sibirica TaxID=2479048 RepID=A0A4Q0T1M9_9BACT|nr:flagellar hook-associated protein FlgK [Granulicella sibirica]RXH55809.1 Flagellar hook-associated protein FlgK [Granulicella sibirica]